MILFIMFISTCISVDYYNLNIVMTYSLYTLTRIVLKITIIMMAIVEDTMIMGMCMTIEWYQLFKFTYSNFRIIYDL